MSIRLVSLVLILAVYGLSFGRAADGAATAGHSLPPVYMSPDKISRYTFDGSMALFTYVEAQRDFKYNEKYSGEYTDDIGGNAPSHDCSNFDFRCVTLSELVMAVPRGELAPNASYNVMNNTLRVFRCLRGTSRICQVALIEAECFYDVDANKCDLEKKDRARTHRRALYFFYNEDYGITAFGYPDVLGDSPIISAMEMYDLAGAFQLVGNNGLLKKELPSGFSPR
jgi:hypothetical protein